MYLISVHRTISLSTHHTALSMTAHHATFSLVMLFSTRWRHTFALFIIFLSLDSILLNLLCCFIIRINTLITKLTCSYILNQIMEFTFFLIIRIIILLL